MRNLIITLGILWFLWEVFKINIVIGVVMAILAIIAWYSLDPKNPVFDKSEDFHPGR